MTAVRGRRDSFLFPLAAALVFRRQLSGQRVDQVKGIAGEANLSDIGLSLEVSDGNTALHVVAGLRAAIDEIAHA